MTASPRRILPTAPGKGIRPILQLPVIDDCAKMPDADYLLDAGVGFAFAHAQEFALLAEHYLGHLFCSDAVVMEWRRRANVHVFGPREHPDGPDQAIRDQRLKRAGEWLARDGVEMMTGTFRLPDQMLSEVADLQYELASLPPSQAVSGANGGECASIWEGKRLRGAGRPIVILCTDDDRARRLGQRYGLVARTTPHILREMVSAQRLTPERAFDLFCIGMQVSEPRQDLVAEFSGSEAFA
jgi:hypothetical protein